MIDYDSNSRHEHELISRTGTGKWEVTKTNLKIALSVKANGHRHSIREEHPVLWLLCGIVNCYTHHMKYRKSLSLERNVSRLCHTRRVHSSEPAKTLILVFSYPRLLPVKKKRNNRNEKSVHPLWRFLGGLTRGLQEPSVCCCCKCMHTMRTIHQHQRSNYSITCTLWKIYKEEQGEYLQTASVNIIVTLKNTTKTLLNQLCVISDSETTLPTKWQSVVFLYTKETQKVAVS